MIELQIQKAFYGDEVCALRDFQLTVQKGETVTVIGKSGSGKSTLLKIIAGLHKDFDGSLSFKAEAALGFVPQNKCLLPWKTALQNVALLHKVKTTAQPSDDERLTALMKRLGIYELRDKFSNRLSGGEYQRVVLGQVFYYEPEIILLDEPFSALDMEIKEEIMKLYLSLQREKAITTVFVTHDTFEAEYMNGRIIHI